jgi:uncharacterized membrane protein YwzB
MSIVGLLVALVLLCVVIWAAQALLAAFAIKDPLRTVIWVVVVILAVFIVLGYIGAPMPYLRR